MRKAYLIRIYPEVYVAFKRLCDASGYRRLNEAVEGLMLRCMDAGSLGLPPINDRYTRLIHRVKLLKKRAELRKGLGRKEKAKTRLRSG